MCRLQALEIHQVGVLDDESPVRLSCLKGISRLIVDNKDVAQWAMDQVESEVRVHLPGIAVVLNQSVQKHGCTERIVQSGSDQVGGKRTFRQVYFGPGGLHPQGKG